jgi:hypothetical protein
LAPVASAGTGARDGKGGHRIDHVIVISVDGLHQSDLQWYVARHPGSTLAGLVAGGTSFTQARTPYPSDSFPGLVGQFTGGNPATTGIWYDVSYNPTLLAPGTTNCAGATPGTSVAYDESIDRDSASIDAGQGLSGLPGSILSLTGSPQNLIDPAALPVDPKSCSPVYPPTYLRVNTVFNVARVHGLRTAWSDKHPSYEILDGPSGDGVQDLFTPEINSSTAFPTDPNGPDWTKDNAKTQQYDADKVRAVLNEIDGYDHSRTTKVGVPAVFGLNFQSVSTGQKLPTSGGQPGGYLVDGVTPGPVLTSALDFVDGQVGRLRAELTAQHLTGSTAIVLSAKHGQSPTDGTALTRIDDGPVLDALDTGWKAAGGSGPLVAGSMDDDGVILWLTDHSPKALAFARHFLLSYNGNGTGSDAKAKATGITGAAKAYTAAGLREVLVGGQVRHYAGANASDPRVPDLIGFAQHGTVYTSGKGKIAEHGGNDPQDHDVPLIVLAPGAGHAVVGDRVSTVQIAPTVLRLLGLNPAELDAVRIEHTAALPLG